MTTCSIVKTIGKTNCPAGSLRLLARGTVIEKFFVLGYLGGAFSMLLMGLYAWAMRTGLLSPTPQYFNIRSLHIFGQIYLFGLPFIAGFYVQAGSKLFESSAQTQAWHLPILTSLVTAPVCLLVDPAIARAVYLCGLSLLIFICLRYLFSASVAGICRSGGMAIVSLCA